MVFIDLYVKSCGKVYLWLYFQHFVYITFAPVEHTVDQISLANSHLKLKNDFCGTFDVYP